MELDISDFCSMGCVDCVRGCNILGPEYNRGMLSVADVKQFMTETEDLNHTWKLIKLIGGEPTEHPDVLDIASLLYPYCRDRGTQLQINTNMATQRARQICIALRRQFPKMIIMSSHKTLGKTINKEFFLTPWIRPEDVGEANAIQKGHCWCVSRCGMGFSSTGFGICCNVHNYVRAYKTTSELKTLADLFNQDKIIRHMELFCINCGVSLNHSRFSSQIGEKIRFSKYWHDFFKREHPVHWESISKGELICIQST